MKLLLRFLYDPKAPGHNRVEQDEVADAAEFTDLFAGVDGATPPQGASGSKT